MRSGDVVIVTGDWNCGFGDVALSQVKATLPSHGVKHGIDMILTNVPASGGAHNGQPSDHPLIKAEVNVGGTSGGDSSGGGGGGGSGGGAGTRCPNTMACNGNECFTCKARAEWVHGNLGVSQEEADRRIKGEFPNECASCVSAGGNGGSDPKCFDLESHCNSWQQSGYCQGQYHESMKYWCPASCGHCASGLSSWVSSVPKVLELPPEDANNTGDDDLIISGSIRIVAVWLPLAICAIALNKLI